MSRQRRQYRSRRKARRLWGECLEPRHLMAVDSLPDGLELLDSLTFTSLDDTAEVATNDEPSPLAQYAETVAVDAELSGGELLPEAPSPPPALRHNSVHPSDVDASGVLTPLDALLVINHLNQGDPSLAGPDDDSAPGVFHTDVNGDGAITSADVDALLGEMERITEASEGEAELPQAIVPPPPAIPAGDKFLDYITSAEVQTLLARAAGATSTTDAIIVIVDRGGTILGVRMEDGVLANIPDTLTRVFAIDGAVAKARTAAFFANNEAPLTSRTIRNLSQSTITERLIESNPTVPDPTNPAQNPFDSNNAISRTFGPGVVAPIGIGGHFPQDIAHTPPVDLFNIELQSRDGLKLPGLDGIKGTADDIVLDNRFNVPDAFMSPGVTIPTPESYGVQSGLAVNAIGRGIATLPGGIPLYKDIDGPGPKLPILVGGIGVFFPGLDGYATHEQGFIPNVKQTSTQRLNANKALEAEFIAFAAAGGAPSVGKGVGAIAGIALPPWYTQLFGRIDLVGIQLEVFGPNPTKGNAKAGVDTLLARGRSLGEGNPYNGENFPIDSLLNETQNGQPVAEGWLVLPHDSPLPGANQLKQADVEQIVARSIAQANQTRAAIRLDVTKSPPRPGRPTKMVIAVADTAGNVLGIYRMPDATIFSIDVAVAKARNTAYYADATALVDADKVDDDLLIAKGAVTTAQLNKLKYKNNGGVIGTPDVFTNAKSTTRYSPTTGLAFTNRTFRFLAEPRYPSGVDGSLPPVFSILTDPGVNRKTAENVGAPVPASWFTSVVGFDAFHASRNFHDPSDLANQNGIVFFPGSTPLYKGTTILVGGFGISGDGVDQDDVVTFAGQQGFAPPQNLRADMLFYRSVRLPFQKFNRNPQPL